MSRLTLLLIILFLTSCKENKSYQKGNDVKYTLYSEMIQKLSLLPPPDIEIIEDENKYRNYKDSISNVPVNIYILDSTIIPNLSQDVLPNKFKEFSYLISQLNQQSGDQLDIKKITSKKNQNISLVENPKEILDYENISYFVRFSEIVLDSKKSMGVFYVSVHLSDKAGEYKLILVRKINDKWKVVHEITLEIS